MKTNFESGSFLIHFYSIALININKIQKITHLAQGFQSIDNE